MPSTALDRGDVGSAPRRRLWRHRRGQAATRLANVALLEHVDAVIKGGKLVKGPAAQ